MSLSVPGTVGEHARALAVNGTSQRLGSKTIQAMPDCWASCADGNGVRISPWPRAYSQA